MVIFEAVSLGQPTYILTLLVYRELCNAMFEPSGKAHEVSEYIIMTTDIQLCTNSLEL